MSKNNVVLLEAVRENKELNQNLELFGYRARILEMDKLALLDEMVNFQEERTQEGDLTKALIQKGQILFQVLQDEAETDELKNLAKSYRKHLALEAKRFNIA